MSCCFSREDPIGCCGIACPHDDEARQGAQEMMHEMSRAEYDTWVADNQTADAEIEMKTTAACVGCEPRSPNDQCPVHGYDQFMWERARDELNNA